MNSGEFGHITFGVTEIEYRIRRSSRRHKTVEVILDPAEGLLVAAPVTTSAEAIQAIVRKRAPWILQRASDGQLQARRKQFVSGETLPYLGRQARLFVEHADVGRVRIQFEHWRFNVTVPAILVGEDRRGAIEAAMQGWYREQAKRLLPPRLARWSRRTGLVPRALLIRDQRQRWGSCSADGTLRFNWRSVMLAPALIDYVLVHELTHLKIRNHSAEFWRDVTSVMPDCGVRRSRLRDIGHELAF